MHVITTLAFAGYRSLRDLVLRVGPLTAITGGNGTGKSNVYRALRLLVDAADGQLARALAKEGGMPSAMWAGAPAKKAREAEGTRLSIGFADDAIVVSHAAPLVDAICQARGAVRIELAKAGGETIVAGRAPLEAPPWKWTT